MNSLENKERMIGLGGKEWVKNGHDRVYISCDILNKIREETGLFPVNFSEKTNKIFFDVEANAIMRSYKGKKPAIEIQL